MVVGEPMRSPLARDLVPELQLAGRLGLWAPEGTGAGGRGWVGGERAAGPIRPGGVPHLRLP